MKKGFTLIEMILYLAVLSIVLLAFSAFIFMSYTSRIKSTVVAEVEQQGNQTMNIITNNIRGAVSITSPASGSSAASLTLAEYVGANSPTTFALSGNTITMTEGANPAVSITSNRVVASSLSFQNLSRASTPGIVRVSFTLTHVNPSNRGEYIYAKTFVGTASLRWP